MYRRNQCINIPTEILRTLVVIVDKGSFTKAAEHLGLSQPGISAQIKRLQIFVGGAVFDRTSSGVALSERGKLLLPLARTLLETNDGILCLGGAAKDPAPVRLGISNIYAPSVVRKLTIGKHDEMHIHCDQSDEIAKGLADGYLDIGCLIDPPPGVGQLVAEWKEDLVWVRAREFVLSPGVPIPVVGWPGFLPDQIGIEALQAKGSAYRLDYVSSDHASRMCAVVEGLGVMVLPVRSVDPSVRIAREYYLPSLFGVRAGVCVRKGFELRRARDILSTLTELASCAAPEMSRA